MSMQPGPTIGEYLTGLERAVDELANTWRPDDPAYRADVYRQIMMNLSYAYFVYFHADPEHPDWAPLWNPVYTHQPNPDDIYFYAPIRGDLTYRVSGNRGAVSLLMFNTMNSFPGLEDERPSKLEGHFLDAKDLEIGADGEFEVIFSAERPAGHTGNWAPMGLGAIGMMVRCRSVDWARERDPVLSIECLDDVPLKRRLSPQETLARIETMAKYPARLAKRFLELQNATKARVGVNAFEKIEFAGGGGVASQVYWPAVYEITDDEALIVETDLPKVRRYWNIQVNDPYFNAAEYVYRLSSLNEATAKISSDGRFRAVVALQDPGVPNWLDTAGFHEGTLYGRWYECDSAPLPTIKRVSLADLRRHLPADTPVVTPEARALEIRARVRAAQRRRRW